MLEQIQIQGIHYDLSNHTIEFIKEKLSKIDFLDSFITDGTIRIIRDGEHYKAEADIHLHKKHHLHIDTKHEQLYPAVENLVHKLRHKLSEEHKKVMSHHKAHTPSVHHGNGHPDIADPSENIPL